MIRPQSAVLVMEPSSEAAGPLMLSDFLAEPILTRMGRQLLADGIQRFFLVCGPEEAERARACLPEEAEVTVSDQREALAALDVPDHSLACVSGFDWSRDLSPWPAPGLGKGSDAFAGEAGALYRTFERALLPQYYCL